MIYGISGIRLTVYLLIYVANNKWSFFYMSDCISFILRRLWYIKFHIYNIYMAEHISFILRCLWYIKFHIYGWTYTTYCKSSTVRNLYWWHKLFVCLFMFWKESFNNSTNFNKMNNHLYLTLPHLARWR